MHACMQGLSVQLAMFYSLMLILSILFGVVGFNTMLFCPLSHCIHYGMHKGIIAYADVYVLCSLSISELEQLGGWSEDVSNVNYLNKKGAGSVAVCAAAGAGVITGKDPKTVYFVQRSNALFSTPQDVVEDFMNAVLPCLPHLEQHIPVND